MRSSTKIHDVEVRPGLRLSTGPALFLGSCGALVVADVHWGYAASQRQAGRLIPLWGDADIAARLHALLAHYRPGAFVIVGDIVHAAAGAHVAEQALARIERTTRVVLVGGNHDRGWRFPTVETHRLAGYFFHHGDAARDVPGDCVEVIGHHHPAAVWNDGAGTRVKMPALVEGPRRLILPAFSPWAAGAPWNHRLLTGERLWLVSPKRVFRLPCETSPA